MSIVTCEGDAVTQQVRLSHDHQQQQQQHQCEDRMPAREDEDILQGRRHQQATRFTHVDDQKYTLGELLSRVEYILR